MKKITPILILFFLFGSCTGGGNKKKIEGLKLKNDWTRQNLKGKVNSIRKFNHNPLANLDQSQIKQGTDSSAYIFTIEGNLLEENIYSWAHTPSRDFAIVTKTIFKYNEDGFRIEKNWSSLGSHDKYTYKYNDSGNLIEMDKYKQDGSIDKIFSYKYDEKGNLIEEPDEDEALIYTYKYDDKGNSIEKKANNPDGSLKWISIYKNDEKGNLIEDITTSNNSNGSSGYYHYTYKHDEQGNRIEENSYNSDGSLSSKYTYKYDYDKNLNWIKKTTLHNNVPVSIAERMIVYF